MYCQHRLECWLFHLAAWYLQSRLFRPIDIPTTFCLQSKSAEEMGYREHMKTVLYLNLSRSKKGMSLGQCLLIFANMYFLVENDVKAAIFRVKKWDIKYCD